MITKDQIISKYGKPNERGLGYLTTINIPYPMRLAWDKDVIVNKISCHKLIASNLTNVFDELLHTYGLETIKEVSLNLRSLDAVTLSYLSAIFKIDKTEFRCYKHRQLFPNLWNS